MKFILIETDGYSIKTQEFENLEKAKNKMKKQYKFRTPSKGLVDSYKKSSYLGDMDAQLYANGMDVFIWKIVIV